jgi:hypothetical protein
MDYKEFMANFKKKAKTDDAISAVSSTQLITWSTCSSSKQPRRKSQGGKAAPKEIITTFV